MNFQDSRGTYNISDYGVARVDSKNWSVPNRQSRFLHCAVGRTRTPRTVSSLSPALLPLFAMTICSAISAPFSADSAVKGNPISEMLRSLDGEQKTNLVHFFLLWLDVRISENMRRFGAARTWTK